MRTTTRRCASCLLWTLLILPPLGWSADIDKATFQKRFVQPIVVSELGVGQDRLAPLGAAQLSDLLDARAVLGDFFKNLEEPKGSIKRDVTPDFAKATPTRLATRKALVADETTILEVAVSDFQFHAEGKSLELSYYVIVMAEGTLAVSEGKADLMKVDDSSWRISKITAGT
jgi:hypothetical protein